MIQICNSQMSGNCEASEIGNCDVSEVTDKIENNHHDSQEIHDAEIDISVGCLVECEHVDTSQKVPSSSSFNGFVQRDGVDIVKTPSYHEYGFQT